MPKSLTEVTVQFRPCLQGGRVEGANEGTHFSVNY